MNLKINNSEVVTSLECHCESADVDLLRCATCQRDFHLLCDEQTYQTFKMDGTGDEDGAPLDDCSTHLGRIARYFEDVVCMNGSSQPQCFPCRHPEAIR